MNEKKYKQHLIAWIVTTVILVIAAYAMGNKHGQNASKVAFGARTANTARTSGTMGRFAGGTGGLITGTVTSKDDTSITVQDRSGSSKIVLYSATTQVAKSTSGSASDVVVGTQVSAQGVQNSDGSVTASSIQIRPDTPAAPATKN